MRWIRTSAKPITVATQSTSSVTWGLAGSGTRSSRNPTGTTTAIAEAEIHMLRAPQKAPCILRGMMSASQDIHGGWPMVPKRFERHTAVMRTSEAPWEPARQSRNEPTIPAKRTPRSATANQNQMRLRWPIRCVRRAEKSCERIVHDEIALMKPHCRRVRPTVLPK